jgi:hypothetical protein
MPFPEQQVFFIGAPNLRRATSPSFNSEAEAIFEGVDDWEYPEQSPQLK